MNPFLDTRGRMAGAVRSFAVAMGVLGLLLLSMGSALASPPDRYTYDVSGTATLSGVCAFDLDVSYRNYGVESDSYDRSGDFVKAVINQFEQDTFSHDGATLVGEPYRSNGLIRVDGTGDPLLSFVAGQVEIVPLPDGTTFFMAGRIDFLGGATYIFQPTNGLGGDLPAFCAALE